MLDQATLQINADAVLLDVANKIQENAAQTSQKQMQDRLNALLSKDAPEKKLAINNIVSAFTAVTEPVFASGVLNTISSFMEIVTQAAKTMTETAAIEKKAKTQNAAKAEQLAQEFTAMVTSMAERIIRGVLTIAEYKDKQKQLMTGVIDMVMAKNVQQVLEKKNLVLTERTLKDLLEDITQLQPNAMLSALEKLPPELKAQVIEKIKLKLKDMSPEQLVQLLKQNNLPPELKIAIEQILKSKAPADPAQAMQSPEIASA